MIIAVDFDGTIVKHRYPAIGPPVPHVTYSLQKLQRMGCRIILWTMRSGEELEAAVAYVKSLGIQLYGVNSNPEQASWTDSPKVYADVYIDDLALGCPLIHEETDFSAEDGPDTLPPYVDWNEVMFLLEYRIDQIRTRYQSRLLGKSLGEIK